ncbi:conserved hypothetical protein [Theileria equi strain WA]|uniref:tRNA (guanine(37)-N1)-methyltransferase n=1 Tax=Theileria equi strain WA TaxID=1537102 RepID=L1LD90_THEEQ|nr:conserved hypothetical protein [Theileria equi strain WA]EKX73220.1 conserved hypothetical protein [Theileria equi strain WA]|eukprot:XP_004832672.1 conserved hypothetical protein [Theileria equi strain WA]
MIIPITIALYINILIFSDSRRFVPGNDAILNKRSILSPLFIKFHNFPKMTRAPKRKRVESVASDENHSDGGITTVEELENYQRMEERTRIVISKEKIGIFGKAGLFRYEKFSFYISHSRNLVKRSVETKDGIPEMVYILKKWDQIPSELQDVILKEAIEHSTIFHPVRYSDLSVEEAFKLILNEENGIMVGFETIGHIAHLNIPDERRPVKKLIAKIIMDKHKNITTVVNKRSELQNEFRTMDLELLAGEENYVASLVENGLKFEVDFANVYWNSRLVQERVRIRDLLKADDVVVDMFAGVGPFVIYAAKKGCFVLANDLNPVGAKYVKINSELNRVCRQKPETLQQVTNLVKIYNQDARTFLDVIKSNHILDKKTVEYDGVKISQNAQVHFLMNLPKLAIDFLDSFIGLANNIEPESTRDCVVHCYCFCDQTDYENEVETRLQRVLNRKLDEYTVTRVRHVSPKKQMYCVEFKVPGSMLGSSPETH